MLMLADSVCAWLSAQNIDASAPMALLALTLAGAIDCSPGARDLAGLAGQLRGVLTDLARGADDDADAAFAQLTADLSATVGNPSHS